MIAFHKILVPTDFSADSRRALKFAQDLAGMFDAEIIVVHVLEPPVYPAMTFGAGAATLPSLQDEMRQAVSAHLSRIMGEEFAEGANARSVLREGSPFYEILSVAREEAVDLIVIATHGHTGIKHLLLGSTAEKVVRKASCPVLTIRDPEHEFELP